MHMNMPGFTAETSLHQTRGRYRARAGAHAASAGGREVVPQLPIGWCMADCDEQYPWGSLDNFICKYNCTGDGDGGGTGGGGEPRCRPRCSPCRGDMDSESGRSRTCLRADCDEITVPC
jgi:hypothetical protein